MLKRGLDQITAWIFAVFLTGAVGTGVFFATKWSAAHRFSEDGEELSDQGPTPAVEHHEADLAEKTSDEAALAETRPEALGLSSTHPGPTWDYKGSSGPDHWGELADAYRTCKTGKSQSPVDIDEPVTNAKLLPIRFHYKSGDVVWKNNGHTVLAEVPSGSYLEVDGDRYDLLQFHFHAPSEHKLSGAPYDMELHFVHKSAAGKFLVLGVLFEEGKVNSGLLPLWKDLPSLNETNPEPIAFDPTSLLPEKKTFFQYAGSLTAPPCTEGIGWYVLTTPVEVAGKQVDEIVRVSSFNARPVQPLNGRKILKSTR